MIFYLNLRVASSHPQTRRFYILAAATPYSSRISEMAQRAALARALLIVGQY